MANDRLNIPAFQEFLPTDRCEDEIEHVMDRYCPHASVPSDLARRILLPVRDESRIFSPDAGTVPTVTHLGV
jgi:hypothetical protein